ncbi:hypothetical protein GRI58_13130 [Porphyrobacter algicida]|uniref:Uncharacterized protein n=1 Tax=Qipengyuania algicida TaxID=1836209 RepID=A0A845ALI7_9SPHN|nr:hypothetical protein [Qipengyuania algicida]MXP29751.1 hypothetical protein [Qipengyuania algicida]
MFRKSPNATVPAFAAIAAFGAALSLAAPAFAHGVLPPRDSTRPVCSASITDNCVQHEPGSIWYRNHEKAMLHRTAWKHKAEWRQHAAKKA